MRAGLALFAAGLLLLGGAMFQSWGDAAGSARPSAEERQGALESVKTLISLTHHFRGAGGDPRFLERLPATPELVEEIRREHQFAGHLGVLEEATTARLDVADVRRVEEGRLEVDVTEYRTTRISRAAGGEASVRSDVVRTRYEVARLPGGWTVVGREQAPLMAPPVRGD